MPKVVLARSLPLVLTQTSGVVTTQLRGHTNSSSTHTSTGGVSQSEEE